MDLFLLENIDSLLEEDNTYYDDYNSYYDYDSSKETSYLEFYNIAIESQTSLNNIMIEAMQREMEAKINHDYYFYNEGIIDIITDLIAWIGKKLGQLKDWFGNILNKYSKTSEDVKKWYENNKENIKKGIENLSKANPEDLKVTISEIDPNKLSNGFGISSAAVYISFNKHKDDKEEFKLDDIYKEAFNSSKEDFNKAYKEQRGEPKEVQITATIANNSVEIFEAYDECIKTLEESKKNYEQILNIAKKYAETAKSSTDENNQKEGLAKTKTANNYVSVMDNITGMYISLFNSTYSDASKVLKIVCNLGKGDSSSSEEDKNKDEDEELKKEAEKECGNLSKEQLEYEIKEVTKEIEELKKKTDDDSKKKLEAKQHSLKLFNIQLNKINSTEKDTKTECFSWETYQEFYTRTYNINYNMYSENLDDLSWMY